MVHSDRVPIILSCLVGTLWLYVGIAIDCLCSWQTNVTASTTMVTGVVREPCGFVIRLSLIGWQRAR